MCLWKTYFWQNSATAPRALLPSPSLSSVTGNAPSKYDLWRGTLVRTNISNYGLGPAMPETLVQLGSPWLYGTEGGQKWV